MRRLAYIAPAALLAFALFYGCGSGNTYSPNFQGSGATFRLAAAPSTETVLLGNTATFTVTLTSVSGFAQPVSLSVSGLPQELSGIFSPASVTPTALGAKSTLTIDTDVNLDSLRAAGRKTVAAGKATRTGGSNSYPLTITGTGGGITQTANVTCVITSGAPDYTVTGGVTTQTVAQGGTATFTFTVASVNGFTSSSMGDTISGDTNIVNVSHFTPATFSLAANDSQTVTLKVNTTAGTPTGNYTLTMGSGPSVNSHKTITATLTVTAASVGGRIYVADPGGSRIVRMDDMNLTNLVSYWGSGATALSQPYGVTVGPDNRIYIADTGNQRIVRMDDMSGTNFTTYAPSGTNYLSDARAVAVGHDGRIYIAENGSKQIRRIDDMTGANQATYTLSHGPTGVYVDASNHIYIADPNGHQIYRIDDMNGTNQVIYSGGGSGYDTFWPAKVMVGPDGKIYMANVMRESILRIDDMTGANPVRFGSPGSGAGQFGGTPSGGATGPWGLFVAPDGRIYAADNNNARITRMDDMNGTNWSTASGEYGPYDVCVH